MTMSRSIAFLKRPPWRTVVPLSALILVAGIGYMAWSPGANVTDGRHDLVQNGIWLQHGWLGDDGWFERYNKTDRIIEFRDREQIRALAELLRRQHFSDVFPHVAPTRPDGYLPPIDHDQATLFLAELDGFRITPWIGGAWGEQAHPDIPTWRKNFVGSIRELLDEYPGFAGVHINIEPCPTGDRDFITLLQEVRAVLEPDEWLSVAAYPPPTRWHRFPEVHWEESYFREVASHVDQVVVMMYDTSLTNAKLYRSLMTRWTGQILEWSGDTEVLLGIPAYDDTETDYHDPEVENLHHSLAGIHAGLLKHKPLPDQYRGIAVYSEWEMQPDEWATLRDDYLDVNESQDKP